MGEDITETSGVPTTAFMKQSFLRPRFGGFLPRVAKMFFHATTHWPFYNVYVKRTNQIPSRRGDLRGLLISWNSEDPNVSWSNLISSCSRCLSAVTLLVINCRRQWGPLTLFFFFWPPENANCGRNFAWQRKLTASGRTWKIPWVSWAPSSCFS